MRSHMSFLSASPDETATPVAGPSRSSPRRKPGGIALPPHSTAHFNPSLLSSPLIPGAYVESTPSYPFHQGSNSTMPASPLALRVASTTATKSSSNLATSYSATPLGPSGGPSSPILGPASSSSPRPSSPVAQRSSSPLTSLRVSPSAPGSYFGSYIPDGPHPSVSIPASSTTSTSPAGDPPFLSDLVAPPSPSLSGPPLLRSTPTASAGVSSLPSPVFSSSSSPSASTNSFNGLSALSADTVVPAENFPLAPPDAPVDMYEDEALTPLEKIYIFSRSEETFHRLFILHHLPAFLEDVTPREAVDYVLPLLPGLAVDEDDTVKEALATELPSIIWWFVTHCQLFDESSEEAPEEEIFEADADADADVDVEEATATASVNLPVQAFTPILGTLLLSPNALVSGPARSTVVEILSRLRVVKNGGANDPLIVAHVTHLHGRAQNLHLFGENERYLLEEELLNQVVIGMGRLDAVHIESNESGGDSPAGAPQSMPESPVRHTVSIPMPAAAAAAAPSMDIVPSQDPTHISLPLSAPPTPVSERPGAIKISPSTSTGPALTRAPGIPGVMISPPLGQGAEMQPWHIALPPTPAAERPWTAASSQEPWSIALPPTPAGEHPWASIMGPGQGGGQPHPATPAGEKPPWDVALPPTPGEQTWRPSRSLEEVNPYFPVFPPEGSTNNNAASAPSPGEHNHDSPMDVDSVSSPTITNSSRSSDRTPPTSITPVQSTTTRARASSGASSLMSKSGTPSTASSMGSVGSMGSMSSASSSISAMSPVPVLSPHSAGSLASTAFSSPMTPPDSVQMLLMSKTAEAYAAAAVDENEDDDTPGSASVYTQDQDQNQAMEEGVVGEGVDVDVGEGEGDGDQEFEEGLEEGLEEEEMDPEAVAQQTEEERAALEQQAAVGRLCSMSLIAAVAAGGPLREETKEAFTEEVARIGRDNVYWVRREVSFAVGSLAKVLPQEVVRLTLMPLLRELCKDEAWHVRHSSLFAMPAVFGCLSAQDRRASALELILPLAADTTPMVRRGVLESLGEVIYCFHADQGGPPDELLRLFLGRDEDRRWWEDWLRARGMRPAVPTRAPSPAELAAQAGGSVQELLRLAAAAEAAANPPNFFDEPARSLVRAFNLPALALTLGVARWGELRGTYLELAESTDAKVRRTLAASTGEIARIVGSGHAAQDVLGVWRASLLHAEADVRLKAIEALETLLAAIEAPQRVGLVQALDGAWASTGLRGWREREAVARTLCAFVGLLGQKADILGPLVRKALEDDVAAVREAAIAAVVPLFEALTGRADVRKRILDNIHKLAEHSSFRKRMTYVACQQRLIHGADGSELVADDKFWRTLSTLANDPVVNVQIGVSRLVGIICDRFYRESASIPGYVLDLVVRLASDKSASVRAFVSVDWRRRPPLPPRPLSGEIAPTFSRPPPPIPGSPVVTPTTSSVSG